MAARGRHLLDSGASSDETGMVVAATPASNSTAEAELTQASFDTNMIIILAALLCALICALGLNSFVRCVLRCARPQTTLHASDAGLRKSALRKIPVVVFGSDPGRSVGPDCPICLGEFVEGEKVRILPGCNHGFHVGCIDTWLGAHSSCPNCRHSLVGVAGSSSKAAAATPWSGGGGPEQVVVEVNS